MLGPAAPPPRTKDPTLGADVRAVIRDVADFPSAGIVFKDITPVLLDPHLFRRAVWAMAAPFTDAGATHIAAIESRGFVLGAPLALELALPLVLIRKQGKLPRAVDRVSYSLEYGSGVLEAHRGDFGPGRRVVLVDDVLATGGTAAAARTLVNSAGGEVAGFSFLVALTFLPGFERLRGERVASVVSY